MWENKNKTKRLLEPSYKYLACSNNNIRIKGINPECTLWHRYIRQCYKRISTFRMVDTAIHHEISGKKYLK